MAWIALAAFAAGVEVIHLARALAGVVVVGTIIYGSAANVTMARMIPMIGS